MATIDRWRPYGTAVERWEPFRSVNEIQGEMDRLLDSFFGRPATLVAGERRFESDVKDEGYYRLERVYGKFERSVSLPIPVQADKVKATYRDGVLEIRLPKVEEVKPKEIKIDVA